MDYWFTNGAVIVTGFGFFLRSLMFMVAGCLHILAFKGFNWLFVLLGGLLFLVYGFEYIQEHVILELLLSICVECFKGS